MAMGVIASAPVAVSAQDAVCERLWGVVIPSKGTDPFGPQLARRGR